MSNERGEMRSGMNAAFEALPQWLREPFVPVRDAASLLFDRGEDATARGLVDLLQCPPAWDESQAAAFAQTKAAMLAGIDDLIATTAAANPFATPEALAVIALAAERRTQE